MKYIKPDYYDEFSCIAQRCRHNCCRQDWEIDVDEDTLAFYRRVPGSLGEELKSSIQIDEDGAHFIFTEEKQCPFLNRQGLCRVVLQLGEEHLCQICTDHPRFRNFFSDREEIGIGLCCEEAGRLILGRKQAVALLSQGWEVLREEEQSLIYLRRDMIRAMQDRTVSIEERWKICLDLGCSEETERTPEEWGEVLSGLERLDEAWGTTLERLKGRKTFSAIPPEFSVPMEQLTVYFLYRHMPGAMLDEDVPGRTAFCILCSRLIWELAENKSMEALIESARAFSSEIEYSEENICALLDEIDEELL